MQSSAQLAHRLWTYMFNGTRIFSYSTCIVLEKPYFQFHVWYAITHIAGVKHIFVSNECWWSKQDMGAHQTCIVTHTHSVDNGVLVHTHLVYVYFAGNHRKRSSNMVADIMYWSWPAIVIKLFTKTVRLLYLLLYVSHTQYLCLRNWKPCSGAQTRRRLATSLGNTFPKSTFWKKRQTILRTKENAFWHVHSLIPKQDLEFFI